MESNIIKFNYLNITGEYIFRRVNRESMTSRCCDGFTVESGGFFELSPMFEISDVGAMLGYVKDILI